MDEESVTTLSPPSPQAMPEQPPGPPQPSPFDKLRKRVLALIATPKSANTLAWVTSVSFHVILFGIAVILVPKIVEGLHQTAQEEILIPDTTLANDNDIGGVPNPGLGKDPTRDTNQDTDPNEDSRGWATRRNEDLARALSGSATPAGDSLAQSNQSQRNAGGDDAVFSLFGASGGPAASFGPRGGGQGMGPKSKIFGTGSNVRSVVYVCDASGSMVGQGDDALKSELKRDIANLSPIQQFNILIFHETRTGALFESLSQNGLIMGTPSNKATAFDFIDNLQFSSVNNPIPALEEAFREQPQLIYLLSHGDFNNRYNTTNNLEVEQRIDDLNEDRRVRVNTTLLLGERRTETHHKDLEAVMQKIADRNHGVLKIAYSDEL